MAYIKINNKQIEATFQTRSSDSSWNGRESKAITLEMTYEEALSTFVDNVSWSIIGISAEGQFEEDASEYAISGPITDNRDGTITVKMGKYKDTELLEIPLSRVPNNHAEAIFWRETIEKTVQVIEDDYESLQLIPLYPTWDNLVKKEAVVTAGFKFSYEGKLYKTISDNTKFQENWIPGVGTESLYVRIDETHQGTLNDPIPYDGNMELIVDKYYSQNEKVYLCFRSTGAPVYNELIDLVGIYVEQVS